ncbi:SMODS domain-containing nucleotidyltransferase [Achromobacter piechaudii]|uniref:Nucleotidyltransferase n=1 Tax=Achromobacter piechaudii TaxID=72556 RepID=A0ABN7F7L5_9BURK|nr:nucleotidyltransferase [Achromobacter piechaudii]CAB3738107.1 hypothetical protein LMG1873_05456 [Achromobacter piechaudii]CAB3921197.1 hypothetical protein LMG2828_05592 [Achromobacter piechaudii]CAB3958452.1 hypothetical protein LMG6103_05423 [Achromobacter piechaudii]
MSVADWFSTFCGALPPGILKRASIADRTGRLTRRLNSDFRDSTSDTANRFYGGSYGRNTAVASVSDIDLMYVLPYSIYKQYDGHSSNGQSALLQSVKRSIEVTYPNSVVIADGQIVQIPFTDNVTFEIVPVFLNTDGSYTFADDNNGGSWKVCWPKDEINAFATRNQACNYNLVPLGRMVRAWRDTNDVPMSGMLIDTLAYQFIETWEHRLKSYLYYDFMTRDFFNFLANQDSSQNHWRAPGSQSWARRTGGFERKARMAHTLAVDAIKNVLANENWAAKNKFRQIYGTQFPS